MSKAYSIIDVKGRFALALQVVGWIVSDPVRADRMLSITGLDPQGLRDTLETPATLRAMLDFVLDHEPDLMACAANLGVEPGEIAAARQSIQ